jgi:hypothetical protein
MRKNHDEISVWIFFAFGVVDMCGAGDHDPPRWGLRDGNGIGDGDAFAPDNTSV